MAKPICLPRRLPALLLVFAVGAAAGCVPNVAWLPDSSGFVYTGGKGGEQLMTFDLATKKARALVEEEVGPGWPALSPDGKRIAVARRSLRDTAPYLTVHVFDRAGKRLHRSKELPWGRKREEKDDFPTIAVVAWSPKGDRLLLAHAEQTGLYDLKTHKVVDVAGNLLSIGPGLVHPDGKGFLTLSPDGYHFVDWDGKARVIKVEKAGVKGKLGRIPDNESDRQLLMAFFLTCESRWDGDIAKVAILNQPRLLIDTGKLVLKVKELKPARKAIAVSQRYTFASGLGVRAVHDPDGGAVEVVPPGKPPATILEEGRYIKFFPSPDRKYLAVCWLAKVRGDLPRVQEQRIFVLDARGNKVADFKAAE